MSNEFYKYIAKNTYSFFQTRASTIQPGERYCLKLDNEDMVKGVDDVLRSITKRENKQGSYKYGTIYSTFTIRLSQELEVVVASKKDGMTDDFLATLRNAELTTHCYPILMITYSAIDTIISGTGDLAAKGMPFHTESIIEKIKADMQSAQLSLQDKLILEMELNRKQMDRYNDKTSLYEYAHILTVLERGYIHIDDYSSFMILHDPDAGSLDSKKLKDRLEDNREIFERIDRAVKYGNIEDDLEKEFDKPLIDHLKECKSILKNKTTKKKTGKRPSIPCCIRD
ncbi:MAG: hypothetical protein IJ708_10700 [Clostridia bacterium]|nr:hypothetical protein [Clostridia bacterium]